MKNTISQENPQIEKLICVACSTCFFVQFSSVRRELYLLPHTHKDKQPHIIYSNVAYCINYSDNHTYDSTLSNNPEVYHYYSTLLTLAILKHVIFKLREHILIILFNLLLVVVQCSLGNNYCSDNFPCWNVCSPPGYSNVVVLFFQLIPFN